MAESKVFYTEADLPLAKSDQVVKQKVEHGVVIERKVFAGTRVPPDLIDAYNEATGGKPADEPDTGDDGAEKPLDKQKVEDLQAKVDELGLEVTGTGTDGNVVKGDLVAALQAHAENS